MRLKRGLVSAPKPACQSIYEKFFTEQKKKKEEWAVDYCVREAERELYRQMLESNLGTILPPRASTIRSPMTTKKKALFPTPAPKSPFTLEPSEVLDSSQDRPLTSTVSAGVNSCGVLKIILQVIKELPKPSTSVLDASPVFSQKAKPRVEEVKEKVRNDANFKFSDNKLLLHKSNLSFLNVHLIPGSRRGCLQSRLPGRPSWQIWLERAREREADPEGDRQERLSPHQEFGSNQGYWRED